MAESRNTQIIRDAWDQYQGDHLKFNIKDRPDFYAFFEKGGGYRSQQGGDGTGRRCLRPRPAGYLLRR